MLIIKTLADLFPDDDYNDKQVDAVSLYEFLEVDQDFDSWIQMRIEEMNFQEGEDYTVDKESASTKIYILSLDMAQNLSIVQENEIGKMVRDYLIHREKAYINSDPKLLGGYEHILKMSLRHRGNNKDDDSIS